MPILSFSAADIARSKCLESGWYGAEITKVEEGASSDKQSINIKVTFVVEDVGKELIDYFNSKINFATMLPLIAAIRGLHTIENPIENFNTNELLGKKVDIQVGVEMYQQRPTNRITGYLPYKSGSNNVPF